MPLMGETAARCERHNMLFNNALINLPNIAELCLNYSYFIRIRPNNKMNYSYSAE